MSEVELIEFNTSWGIYVRNEFRLPGNDSLLESCKSYAGLNKISPDQAAFIIVKALWEKLQHSNVLKIVK